jgi:hypothetical protein
MYSSTVPNKRLRNAHATQDEVLPGRFQAGRRAVDADQQHGRQRGRFHGHPDDAQVVGGQRQQHGEAEELVHAVIQAQAWRRHLAVVTFHAHVGAREDRRRQAHKGRQRDEKDVQRVDVELAVPHQHGPAVDHLHGQHAGGDEGAQAEGHVHVACVVAVAHQAEHDPAEQRNAQQQGQCGGFNHP